MNMVILLDGTSSMGRTAIAEQVVEILPAWRHLALEVIQEYTPPREGADEHMRHIEIVRKCALELERDGLHLILSMPESAEQAYLLRTTLDPEPRCITIHLGEGDEEGYDYAFDSSISSVKEIVGFLETLIRKLPNT